jgi:hypothetical protein
MWARVAARSPDDENMLSVYDFWGKDWLIDRIQGVAATPYPRLGLRELSRGQSHGRQLGDSVLFLDSNDDIAAV